MRIKEFNVFKNNQMIAGRMYIPNGEKTVYPTVIASHEFGLNYTYYIKYAKYLAKQGIVCCIFDFCGGGKPSKSDGKMTEMSVLTELEDLQTVYQEVKKQVFVDDNQIFLLGGSQGGYVSALLASKIQTKIKGLILLYPAFIIYDDTKELKKQYAVIPDTYPMFGYTVGKKYHEDAKQIDIYEEIGKYSGDVLILHGDCDETVPIEYSKKAVNVYSSAQLKVIKGAKHVFHRNEIQLACDFIGEFIKHRAK